MDNDTYNLMKAIVKKAQAISKLEKYLDDAKDCPDCHNLWEKMRLQEEVMLNEMKDVFRKTHLPRFS